MQFHVLFGSEPYLIELGNHVRTSSDVAFITHDGAAWVFREEEKYKKVIRYGKITVGDNCFLGMRCIILPGVTIGEGRSLLLCVSWKNLIQDALNADYQWI